MGMNKIASYCKEVSKLYLENDSLEYFINCAICDIKRAGDTIIATARDYAYEGGKMTEDDKKIIIDEIEKSYRNFKENSEKKAALYRKLMKILDKMSEEIEKDIADQKKKSASAEELKLNKDAVKDQPSNDLENQINDATKKWIDEHSIPTGVNAFDFMNNLNDPDKNGRIYTKDQLKGMLKNTNIPVIKDIDESSMYPRMMKTFNFPEGEEVKEEMDKKHSTTIEMSKEISMEEMEKMCDEHYADCNKMYKHIIESCNDAEYYDKTEGGADIDPAVIKTRLIDAKLDFSKIASLDVFERMVQAIGFPYIKYTKLDNSYEEPNFITIEVLTNHYIITALFVEKDTSSIPVGDYFRSTYSDKTFMLDHFECSEDMNKFYDHFNEAVVDLMTGFTDDKEIEYYHKEEAIDM